MKYQLKIFPNIAPLFLVIRQIVVQHDLGEVYHGGLGSYSLLLMLVSFFQVASVSQIQKHRRSDARSHKANLAILLLEFFELYGIHFRYETTAIKVRGSGAYVPKQSVIYSQPKRSLTAWVWPEF